MSEFGDFAQQTQLQQQHQLLMGDLQQLLGAEKVKRWFQPSSLIQNDGKLFILGLPNLFLLDWIKQRYLGELKRLVHARWGECELRLKVDGELYRSFRKEEAEFLGKNVGGETTSTESLQLSANTKLTIPAARRQDSKVEMASPLEPAAEILAAEILASEILAAGHSAVGNSIEEAADTHAADTHAGGGLYSSEYPTLPVANEAAGGEAKSTPIASSGGLPASLAFSNLKAPIADSSAVHAASGGSADVVGNYASRPMPKKPPLSALDGHRKEHAARVEEAARIHQIARSHNAKLNEQDAQDSQMHVGSAIPANMSSNLAPKLDFSKSTFQQKQASSVSHGRSFTSSGEPLNKILAKSTSSEGAGSKSTLAKKQGADRWLNERFTLDSFIVGTCNHVAYSAALEVLRSPGRSYNPLFIYGGCGLGKTHLLQGLAREAFRQGKRRIRYMSCENFLNMYIKAVREGDMEKFRSSFLHLEALVLDDVQILENKTQTQVELLHLLDALALQGAQIILASDCRPQLIPNLQKQLQGRFVSGLVCRVEAPDYQTRIAILEKEISMVKVEIPKDVIRYIAEQFPKNVRELNGALVRVLAYASLVNEKLSVPKVQEILEEQVCRDRRAVTLEAVVSLVSKRTGITVAEIKSKTRTRSISEARQIAIYLARELTEFSLSEVGQFFGGRNHATANFSYRKVAKKVAESEEIMREIEVLKNELR